MSVEEPGDPGLATKAFEVLGKLAEGISLKMNVPEYLAWGFFGVVALTLLYIALVTVENVIRWIRYMLMVLWAILILGVAVALRFA
ncbi:MAG: hypothetical protein KAQ99_09830 [Candidatus Aureabacteria bacterium]|nr:hypothetical protein [Candidatus Auribacterota bacterium]